MLSYSCFKVLNNSQSLVQLMQTFMCLLIQTSLINIRFKQHKQGIPMLNRIKSLIFLEVLVIIFEYLSK